MTFLQKLFVFLTLLFGVYLVITNKPQARAMALSAERITGRRFNERFDRVGFVVVGLIMAIGSLLILLGIIPVRQ